MLLAIILLLLYLLSRYNYLLYHCAVELFSVFVALAIFVVAWNTRAWTTNRYLVFLGVAYLFVALIDTTHTLAYKGMGVLPTHGANEATQLWILARYMEALSLLAAPLFITRRLRTLPLFLLYAAATGFGLLAIWRLGIFPVCFVEGQGLTPFKVISEYVICGLLVGAIAHTLRYRERFASRILSLLVVAMAATVVEELAFTLYTDVYGILNVVGHLLKATSFYLIYRAIVVTGLATPYQLLFDDLISARTAAQRERDTARRYLDVAGVMLVVLDRSGSIVLINRKAAQVLECTEKEVIGLDWFETFLPASQRVSRRDILRRLMAGDAQETRDSAYSQTLVVTTSGAERTISWHDTVVHDTDGTIVGTLSSGEDVTSRLATESALRDSEERFRLLFENTPDAVYVTNVEGTSFQANLAWLNLFGYKAEELSTFRAVDAYESAADRERFLRSMEQQDVLRDEEVRLKKRDGTVMECIRIVAAVRDADGRVIAFQGVIHDVTEQKRAARALLVSENRYRSLFEQSMDAIALTTPDGRVTEANDAWLRLFAYPREALGSLNVLDLYEEPRDRTRFLERISAQGTLVDDEIRLKRRDGSVIDCVTTIVRLRSDDGTLLGFQSIIHDVTDRKKAEAALRKSEEKYRSLFERSLDAVCLVAVDGTLLDANPAYLKLYGYDAGDIGRVNVNDHYQAPERREELLRVLEQSDVAIDNSIGLRRKDGTVMECQRSSVAVRDAEGRLVAIQSVVRDVTEPRRAERDLRESELRFRTLVEHTGVAVLLTRTDGPILDCNDTAIRMLGYSRDELLSTPVPSLYRHPEDREYAISQVQTNGFVRGLEVELVCKDGTPLYAELATAAVPLHGQPGAITELHDITERRKAEASLHESHRRLEQVLQGTLEVIQQMTEARDPYTSGHQRRVAELSEAMARKMGLPEESCVSIIRTAALVHDIGKVAVPAEILSKPGELSAAEYNIIRSHSQVGYDILRRSGLREPVPLVVLQHHERLDGSGYPQRLVGDDILPEAQILAVADVVEAMSSHRPYRPALGTEAALAEVSGGSGTKYYPDVVNACIAVFREAHFKFSH